MNRNEIMYKKFGVSEITRGLFEILPCPICMTDATDEQMEKLADYVEAEVRNEYPEIADRIFELWQKEELTQEERDFLDTTCYKAIELWWEVLEEYAIGILGAKYYGDSY